MVLKIRRCSIVLVNEWGLVVWCRDGYGRLNLGESYPIPELCVWGSTSCKGSAARDYRRLTNGAWFIMPVLYNLHISLINIEQCLIRD
jgi:hypothetical protein